MKYVNLLIQALSAKNLNEEEIELFVSTETQVKGEHVRKEEYNDLNAFIHFIGIDDLSFYDYFYLNYSIPHIGKEFDILRLGSNYHINIELKSIKPLEGILAQLKQNQQYLNFLGKKAYCFTYEVYHHKLYLYDSHSIHEVQADILIDLLKQQEDCYQGDLDDIFKPENYLISPFNDPIRFIQKQYFLNQEQYTRKMEILDAFKLEDRQMIILNGNSGSGKTLLIYDLVKELDRYCIFHLGNVSKGQKILIEDYHFHIVHSIQQIDFQNIKYLIIDEAELLDEELFNHLLNQVEKYSIHTLFVYDPKLDFKKMKYHQDIQQCLIKHSTLQLHIKGRVRGSKEINYFIDKFFDLHAYASFHYQNIHVYPFEEKVMLEKMIEYLTNQHQYTYIALKEAKEYIGKEYDGIITIIDPGFYYNETGKLDHQDINALIKLYDILSKAKTRLILLTYQNLDVYKTLLHILN